MSKEKTTWQRRKYRNTKPNFLVRSIWNVVDWIGEFGGIASAAKRTTGYMVAVAVSTLVTLSILVASTIHSVELLEHAGLSGGLQYVMLLPFEVLFLTSSSALNKSILQGKWFPLFPWAGFLVSLVFIWRSNVTGLAPNIDGQVLAWSTPFLLLISKGLLGWYVKHGNVDSRREAEPAATVIEDNRTEERTADQVEEKQDEKSVPETIEPIILEDEKTDDISPEMIEENAAEIIEEKEQPAPEKNEEIEAPPAPEIVAENIEENADEITPEKADEKKADKPKRRKASSTKKKSRKSSKKTAPNYEEILAIAEQLKNDETIDANQLEKEIEKTANCSRYFAKKALAELEKKEAEKEELLEQKNEPKFAVVAGGRN